MDDDDNDNNADDDNNDDDNDNDEENDKNVSPGKAGVCWQGIIHITYYTL